jgi:YD repeat-containing protein
MTDAHFENSSQIQIGVGRVICSDLLPDSLCFHNVKSDKRTIGGQIYTTTYEYDLADRIFKVNYPSGRIVTYNRDTDGRITQVTTKQTAAAASVTLSNTIVYQPMSRLLKSMTYGNGLNDFNTYTTNYELDVLGVYNGAASVINRSHTRTDAQNLTNIFDNVTPANNSTFWMTNANRLQNANGPWGAKTFFYDGVGNRTQEISTPTGGATTTDVLAYPATSNRRADAEWASEALARECKSPAGRRRCGR